MAVLGSVPSSTILYFVTCGKFISLRLGIVVQSMRIVTVSLFAVAAAGLMYLHLHEGLPGTY